jgi:hypothetical protein
VGGKEGPEDPNDEKPQAARNGTADPLEERSDRIKHEPLLCCAARPYEQWAQYTLNLHITQKALRIFGVYAAIRLFSLQQICVPVGDSNRLLSFFNQGQ